MALKKNFTIEQGRTFSETVRWETEPIVYVPITAMPQAAPLRVTAAAHGMPDGWRAAIVGAQGMTEFNAQSMPPSSADLRRGTVADEDTVEFNDVSAALARPYTSGGFLAYYTPASLDGLVGRMSIKDKVGGTELLRLTSDDGSIEIVDAAKAILLFLSAEVTAAITWRQAVYDLEVESLAGAVTLLLSGTVTVAREVTST